MRFQATLDIQPRRETQPLSSTVPRAISKDQSNQAAEILWARAIKGHLDPLKADDAFFLPTFMPVSQLYLTLRFPQSDATPDRQAQCSFLQYYSFMVVIQNQNSGDKCFKGR